MKLNVATANSAAAANNNNGSNYRKKSLVTNDSNVPVDNADMMAFQQYYRKPMGKYVEWDTNFSGNWEMEQDPIKEFMNKQRVASDGDFEPMNNGSERKKEVTDDGYDNVFKMKRSDVNEEQTMLIKSFLSKPTTATTNNEVKEIARNTNLNHLDNASMFGMHVEPEDYFNLISPIESASLMAAAANGNQFESRSGNWSPGEEKRRLFEREVSSESLVGKESIANEEETPTEFDANLDAFNAKFGTNIKNLWKQDEAGANEDAAAQPLSLNSFWQNYNKHLYEFQDAPPQQNDSLNSGGWPMAATSINVGPGSGEAFHHQQNVFSSQRQTNAIWSNDDLNEYEDPQNSIQQYHEHMAAAYNKQMSFNENLCFEVVSGRF